MEFTLVGVDIVKKNSAPGDNVSEMNDFFANAPFNFSTFTSPLFLHFARSFLISPRSKEVRSRGLTPSPLLEGPSPGTPALLRTSTFDSSRLIDSRLVGGR
jgi:hypothetical protein